jgi:hypothetical protein
LYIANSIAGKLDIVNFANPAAPVAISSINITTYGGINSIVAYDSIIACAIESVPAQNNGKVVFFDYNGNYINQVEVGAMPDMITFDRNYTKLLTANEGEPDATYANDPVGSVSIIDLTPGYSALTNANVTNVGFTAYNGQEVALRAQGIRVFSSSTSVAQDIGPRSIARPRLSPNSSRNHLRNRSLALRFSGSSSSSDIMDMIEVITETSGRPNAPANIPVIPKVPKNLVAAVTLTSLSAPLNIAMKFLYR